MTNFRKSIEIKDRYKIDDNRIYPKHLCFETKFMELTFKECLICVKANIVISKQIFFGKLNL